MQIAQHLKLGCRTLVEDTTQKIGNTQERHNNPQHENTTIQQYSKRLKRPLEASAAAHQWPYLGNTLHIVENLGNTLYIVQNLP